MNNYVLHRTCELESQERDGIATNPPASLSCPNCAGAWHKQFEETGSYLGNCYILNASFTHCDHCGRFGIRKHSLRNANAAGGNWPISRVSSYRYRSEIKRFPLSGNQVPIEALRSHLIGHYDDIRSISPQQAEELVLSVFREYYGRAEVTYFRGSAYTPDEGIDIAVVDVDTGVIGVQVKRRVSRRTEPVMEIRSFVTSLFSNGIRNGVYVALASRFSTKGKQLVDNEHLNEMGLSLRLVDSDAFFDMLNSESFRIDEPPWYSLLKDYRGFADEPYVQELLRQYTGFASSTHTGLET